MSAHHDHRKYDIVVLGAIGFTGKYISEHLSDSLPTSLKWAIAGRSEQKLQQLRDHLTSRGHASDLPTIDICSLEGAALDRLAQSTRVLITAVGPYAIHGRPVVEACVKHGTHYFDVTGETPWVHKMVHEFDTIAKTNKAIIIPQIGVESAPADLLSWAMVNAVRDQYHTGTAELVCSTYDMKGSPSGGTLSTIFSLFDHFSMAEVRTAMKPWSINPLGPPRDSGVAPRTTWTQRMLGLRTVPDLGILTTSIQGSTDATEVYRSSGLIDNGELYGRHFRFSPYMKTRNVLTAILTHIGLAFGLAVLLLRPVRTLLKTMVYKPGDGPSREESKQDRLEYRAIAYADDDDASRARRMHGTLSWEGSMYHLTGVLVAEAAISLLQDDSLAKDRGGGFLTPACLGNEYVKRLSQAGVVVTVRAMQ